MSKLIQKSIIFLLCITLFCMSTINVVCVFANTGDFANSNVMDDLASIENFDFSKYPYNVDGDLSILNFVEYGYTLRSGDRYNFGLYVYLYNPQRLNIVDNKANKILFGVSYSTAVDGVTVVDKYEKFDLQFCNKSDDNLFYKFRVVDRKSAVDGKYIFDRVDSTSRRYDVAEIELSLSGAINAIAYSVGGTYVFTGFAKGCGYDKSADSTLTCEIKQLETVTLDVHSTTFRTGEYKEHHQHDLTSVYFSVPNELLTKYGENLQKIKAEWYEYVTTPIFITDNSTIYYDLGKYLGINVGDPTQMDSRVPYTLYSSEVPFAEHEDAFRFNYPWPESLEPGIVCEQIDWLFDTNGVDLSEYSLSKSRIKNYAYNYFGTEYLDIPGININSDLFSNELDVNRSSVAYVGEDLHHKLVEIDAGDKYNLLGYNDNYSFFQQFFKWLFGNAPSEVDSSYYDISPIHKVTSADMQSSNLATQLFIGEEDVVDFTAFYTNAVAQNETVFLFRFAETDYYSNILSGYSFSSVFGNSSYFIDQEIAVAILTVFFNFDVIELTFSKDGVYSVIPAVSSPVNIFGNVTVPEIIERFDWLDWLNGSIASIMGLIIIVFITLIVVRIIKFFNALNNQRKINEIYRKNKKK
ncbi:MAG: hypothetical protein IJF72_01105 [Clostridia bacterium]|nr:hypothetical protein [Clostridia bacterium]